jgi:hypothetical protein
MDDNVNEYDKTMIVMFVYLFLVYLTTLFQ